MFQFILFRHFSTPLCSASSTPLDLHWYTHVYHLLLLMLLLLLFVLVPTAVCHQVSCKDLWNFMSKMLGKLKVAVGCGREVCHRI